MATLGFMLGTNNVRTAAEICLYGIVGDDLPFIRFGQNSWYRSLVAGHGKDALEQVVFSGFNDDIHDRIGERDLASWHFVVVI